MNTDLKYTVGQRFEEAGVTWECIQASVEFDGNLNDNMHYYAFKYVLKNNKLSQATKTMVGKRHDMKTYYYGRFG